MAHFEQFEGLFGSGSAFSKRVSVLWFACIRSTWKARNDKLFNNTAVLVDQIAEDVKRLAWNWLNIKSNRVDYCLSQWYLNSRTCFGCVDVFSVRDTVRVLFLVNQ